MGLLLRLLGAVGASETISTVGLPGNSMRWGPVTVGDGGVAVLAAVLARRRHAITAIAGGIVGLISAASCSGRFADYTAGSRRPGGTLEYSAALSLLAVSAMPVLLTGMCRPCATNS